MGHSSTKTTELYYARRKNSAAIKAAISTWNISDEKASEGLPEEGSGSEISTNAGDRKNQTSIASSLKNGKMVPRMGFEPMTFGFPWKRSVDHLRPYESDAPPG